VEKKSEQERKSWGGRVLHFCRGGWYPAACGRRNIVAGTTDWSRVTCKRCLSGLESHYVDTRKKK
jgi:hypothetical protein